MENINRYLKGWEGTITIWAAFLALVVWGSVRAIDTMEVNRNTTQLEGRADVTIRLVKWTNSKIEVYTDKLENTGDQDSIYYYVGRIDALIETGSRMQEELTEVLNKLEHNEN